MDSGGRDGMNGRNAAIAEEKSAMLGRAVVEVENFFLHTKEGELYGFLRDVVERPLIEYLLQKTEGNQLKTARILGINRNTLHAKIKKLGIDVGRFRAVGEPTEGRKQ